MHDETTRTSGGDALRNAPALVVSNHTRQSGISIFQGYCLSSQSKYDLFL